MITYNKLLCMFVLTLSVAVSSVTMASQDDDTDKLSNLRRQLELKHQELLATTLPEVSLPHKIAEAFCSKMHDAAMDGNFKEALAMEKEAALLVAGFKAAPLLYESSFYYRCYALATSYEKWAESCPEHHGKLIVSLHKKSLEAVNTYLENYGETIFSMEKTPVSILFHRLMAITKCASATSNLLDAENNDLVHLKFVPRFKEIIEIYNKALKLAELCLQDKLCDDDLKCVIKDLITEIRMDQAGEYMQIFWIPNADKKYALSQVRRIRDELSPSDQFNRAMIKQMLQMASSVSSVLVKSSKQKTTKSGVRTKAIMASNLRKESGQFTGILDEIKFLCADKGGESIPWEDIVWSECLKLAKLDLSDFNVGVEAKRILDSVELDIKKNSDIKGMDSLEQLLEIYQILISILNQDPMLPYLPPACYLFYLTGDLDGAIMRLEVLKQLHEQVQALPLLQISLYLAHLKTMRGDFSDWLALEKVLADAADQRRAVKLQSKATKKHIHIQQIQDAKNANEAKALAIVKSREQREAERALKLQARVNVSDKGKEEASDGYVDSAHTVSAAELERGRCERHMEAEKRRAEAAKLLENTMVEVVGPAENALIEVSSLPDEPVPLPLTELYSLKGVALNVEREIEAGTWKITKEQLKTYFEAMGCVYSHKGGGSHGKIELPGSMHVRKGDETITIMIDAGGSLTVPSWKKGYIKDYLKTQILVARKKLQDLAMKAFLEKE